MRAKKNRETLLGQIADDFRAALRNDPAARGPLAAIEVALTYPGFHAMLLHRLNHRLWRLGVPLLPRVLCILNRFLTGVEIHQAAKIRGGMFIDHGNGVVIGETAEVGRDCVLYHQVTLGGTGKQRGKRHPTLGDNVVVGSGAKILGDIRIGNNVLVGANSVVLKPVKDDCTVVGIPARVVVEEGKKSSDRVQALAHGDLPDPMHERLLRLEGLAKRLAVKAGEPVPPQLNAEEHDDGSGI